LKFYLPRLVRHLSLEVVCGHRRQHRKKRSLVCEIAHTSLDVVQVIVSVPDAGEARPPRPDNACFRLQRDPAALWAHEAF
jgi:hypothetical protein